MVREGGLVTASGDESVKFRRNATRVSEAGGPSRSGKSFPKPRFIVNVIQKNQSFLILE